MLLHLMKVLNMRMLLFISKGRDQLNSADWI